MNQIRIVPKASLGRKYLMAVTGLVLTVFVIGHMLGNLQLFIGPNSLNAYAKSLKDMPAVLWTVRIVLLVLFIAHILIGIFLTRQNDAARPIPYVQHHYRAASPASRTMIWTGLVLLIFVVFHLLHYTWGVVTEAPVSNPATHQPVTNYLELRDAQGRHDVFSMVVYGFRKPVVSIAYIIAMLFLGFHLSHGIQSMFQSVGINHPHWNPVIRRLARVTAVLIVVGNISMPLAVMSGLIHLPAGGK